MDRAQLPDSARGGASSEAALPAARGPPNPQGEAGGHAQREAGRRGRCAAAGIGWEAWQAGQLCLDLPAGPARAQRDHRMVGHTQPPLPSSRKHEEGKGFLTREASLSARFPGRKAQGTLPEAVTTALSIADKQPGGRRGRGRPADGPAALAVPGLPCVSAVRPSPGTRGTSHPQTCPQARPPSFYPGKPVSSADGGCLCPAQSLLLAQTRNHCVCAAGATWVNE